MQIKTSDEAVHAAAVASQQKQVYTSPQFRVYGAVNQFTQGTGGNGYDSATNMTMTSDRACKTNCTRIGTHPLKIGLYLFDYKPEFQEASGYGRQFGVMADEVEAVMPEAVSMHENGYKQVNYAMLGIDLSVRCLH